MRIPNKELTARIQFLRIRLETSIGAIRGMSQVLHDGYKHGEEFSVCTKLNCAETRILIAKLQGGVCCEPFRLK
jgi:hypothetical protein